MPHAASHPQSGPAVARLFQRLLALTFAVAWLSLGSQLALLVGSRGLLPAAPWLAAVRAQGATWTDAPTWLWLSASDTTLGLGIWLGVLLAILVALELRPRLCLALSTALYLGYVVVCRDFLAFQWDNLLLECGALAAFLPARRHSRWIHVLFRLLLFKLYFESGIAKLESPLGDWVDGSAMHFYYQTAPLPTALAYYAHALPSWWHSAESRLTLIGEICVPFLIWGPRRARLIALAAFTSFQLLNIATANYGFFSYLSLFMGVFLLDDEDVTHWERFIRSKLPERAAQALCRLRAVAKPRSARARRCWKPRLPTRARRVLRHAVASFVIAGWTATSLANAFAHQSAGVLGSIADAEAPFRLVNSYHLFMQVTRKRVEPTFETQTGDRWTEHVMKYKPGPLDRAPPFVAPHQPRVDFLLWFYGLSFERGLPGYVEALLEHVCREPGAVQVLFVDRLPGRASAVRIVFYEYRFAPRAAGGWWARSEVGRTAEFDCQLEAKP